VIDTLTTYIPFRLLRPLSPAHSVSSSSTSGVVSNREIVTDPTIQVLTTLLAATIYSVTLFTAFASYLPVVLVTYFDNIPSVETAHSASVVTLLPLGLLLGLAARSFIFTPATAFAPDFYDAKDIVFNPVTANFWETLKYNVWGYSPRSKVVITRTMTLMVVSGVNTFLQCFVTINGVQAIGAGAYAAAWVTAAAIVGSTLGFVGAV
jgi:hypothetical protein